MTRYPRPHGVRRRTAAPYLIAAAALLLALCPALARPPAGLAAGKAPITIYRGLGAWIDMYDTRSLNDPATAVGKLAANDVRTLYIETSNYHWPTAIDRPTAMDAFVEQCHAHGIKVVAWYLPGFKHPTRDYDRSMAAIRYTTAGGQKFDSFALDIEASLVKRVSTRNLRLKRLSQKIRRAVGTRYPLGGIIPSPIGMAHNATYWPDFPYKTVAGIYDVILPMGYYTYHGNGYSEAYSDTRSNITIVRDKTGRPGIPIHVIGGIANASSATETQAFVRCTREYGIIGASMYDAATSNAADWRQLALVRTNPRQKPLLPCDVGYTDPMGNLPGDRTHPKEVFFTTGPLSGARDLGFRLYDAQDSEIRLVVNWKDMGYLKPGPGDSWTEVRTVHLPADALHAGSSNLIGFVAAGVYPDWHVWGVGGVELTVP